MGVGGEWGSGGVKSRVGQRVNKASAISEQSVLPSFFFFFCCSLACSVMQEFRGVK